MSLSKPQSKLTVITGPSGVGKGSLVRKLLESHTDLWLSVSATTREPRPGEIDGQHYFFLDKDDFIKLIEHGGLLEWAKFAGNYYGTLRKPVEEKLVEHRYVLLEIELEGARQIRKSFPDAFQIFLAPPNSIELERRIRGRGTNSEEDINNRLKRAKDELAAKDEFDAIVINDDLDAAANELEELMGLLA